MVYSVEVGPDEVHVQAGGLFLAIFRVLWLCRLESHTYYSPNGGKYKGVFSENSMVQKVSAYLFFNYSMKGVHTMCVITGYLYQNILSIIALVLSFIAIWRSGKFQKDATMPYLSFSVALGINEKPQGLIMENKGMGPAIIREWEIRRIEEGKELPLRSELDYSRLYMHYQNNINFHVVGKGSVLSPNEKIWLISFPHPEDTNPTADRKKELLESIRIEAEFQGIHRQKATAQYPDPDMSGVPGMWPYPRKRRSS
jgi:hypothetical protein